MNNGCQNIGPLLDGYHDGELGSLERWRVQRHLASCAACRDELASLAQVGGWVRAAVGRGPEPDLWNAIERRLPARRAVVRVPRTARVRRRWLHANRAIKAAAGIAAIVLFATADTGRMASLGGASGVVRSVYSNDRPVMVLEAQNSDDPTIIWLMDEPGEQSPEVSSSVGI